MPEHAAQASGDRANLELDLAALGGRSYAFLLDWHFRFIAALFWFGIGLWLLPDGFRLHDNPIFQVGSSAFNWVVIPTLLIYLLYHPLLEIFLQGYTPGKHMAGVQVVAKNGQQATMAAHIVRNIFRLVDSLPLFYLFGIISCMSTKRYQRIGDLLAGTVLVYVKHDPRQRRATNVNQPGQHALSAAQRELIADLLARWHELEKDTRQQLAQDLLRKLDHSLPVSNTQDLDKHLRQRLQHLFN